MTDHHWHLYIEGVDYQQRHESNTADFKYFGLNYRADDGLGSLLMKVKQGDCIYVVLNSPIPWAAAEIFFPHMSPFPISYASISKPENLQSPGQYKFPMMGTRKNSTALYDRAGVFSFQIRVPLLNRSIFENHVIWLDPQIIVSESTGEEPLP